MRTIRQMMTHMAWANDSLLAGLRDHPEAGKEIGRLFRHILVAELVWLTRLEGKSSARWSLWEDSELASLESFAQDNEQRYKRYIDGLTDEDLDRIVEYKNQSGAKFRTSIRDILTHVALHGQYHRGQINSAIRRQSGSPVSLDFIVYSRMIAAPHSDEKGAGS
ncbi:DinB family protein [Cohnella hongkongensis]|uniref:DinB family protein n=1 Tax=Cohnella hongkongensis TaxID=178337 RepID=A0ABV9F7U0_9BACL